LRIETINDGRSLMVLLPAGSIISKFSMRARSSVSSISLMGSLKAAGLVVSIFGLA